ncbi:AraC family transcriptional regulator [Pseudomonas phoenicis]
MELPSTKDWVRHSPHTSKLERLEAFFSAHGFAPHRHDTYAIGRTLSGVQSFRYRGEQRNSLPGETLVLHPDEEHDGHAGNDSGFRYRMLYITPELAQQVLHGKPLPFLQGGISSDPRVAAATDHILCALDVPLDPLEEDDAIFQLFTTLQAVCGERATAGASCFKAADRAREYMLDNLQRPISLDDLAECTGRDKWSLSKDYRVYFGTSPHRYLTMRRLDRMKAAVFAGKSLVDASMEAGFFDQSHMTRHFKKAFGVSPARWCRSIDQAR